MLFKRLKNIKEIIITIFFIFFSCISHPALADLPKPPDADIANGTKDWGDVGSALLYKVLTYSCIILGVVILIGVAATVMKAFHTAHEKQDLGHFFKILIVGLIAASIGAGLLYAAYQIIPQSS
jgi:hypothetical protein